MQIDRNWPVTSRKDRYLAARAVVRIGKFNTARLGGVRQPTVLTLICPLPAAAFGKPNLDFRFAKRRARTG
jgi:hypothetical protein